MNSPLFFIGLAFILTHEMDAIKCHEWRIFPLLSKLDDKMGYLLFTGAHILLYLLLLWYLYADYTPNQPLLRGLNIFFIVHLLLHLAFRKHPQNEFKSAFSWFLIVGTAVAGTADLLVSW